MQANNSKQKGNTVSKKKAGLEKNKIVPKKSLRPSSIVTSS